MSMPYRLAAALAATPLALGCEERAPTPKPAAASATAAASRAASSAVPSARWSAKQPMGLPPVRAPAENPTTAAKIELGRQLFFDRRLSVDGTRSCYDCHRNEDGTGGHDPTAIGAKGKKLSRHAPILWNVAYLPALYWDGRSSSLEAQMKGAWAGGNMGVGKENLKAKAQEIGKIAEYRHQLESIWPGRPAGPDLLAMAVAAYERTLLCGDTAFDRFVAGNTSALDTRRKEGWKLFSGKAACASCHPPPMFSDAYSDGPGGYHNTGVGLEGVDRADVDPGRQKVSDRAEDWARFKTPTLRNVAKSGPYFHDGSVPTLRGAVELMAKGGFENDNRDEKLQDRKLTGSEIASLVAFLEALDCPGELVRPKLP